MKITEFTPWYKTVEDIGLQGIAYKMGKLVYISINGTINLGISESAYIYGLPYPVKYAHSVGAVWISGVTCGNCTINMGDSSILLRKFDVTALKYSEIVNNPVFISGCYLTST